jgi:hypothetical protein
VDRHLDKRLGAEGVPPSPLASDAEFLRRVYLDLTGHVPPADKVAAFLDNHDPEKRAKLIDELVAGPDFGRHLADIWQALLVPRTSETRRLSQEPLTKWLEERFNANLPWDRMVRELLTAEGNSEDNAAVTYYLGHQLQVDRLTDNVTRLFLGVQLQCAQCHNHPFTGWKQAEYWGMAAFFLKVRVAGNPRQAVRRGNGVELHENGRGRPARLPDSAKVVPARFLQGAAPAVAGDAALRPILAEWLVSPRNPYFARAMVNRAWAQLFGRGIVNPVDDMHDGNVPSHPELLRELTEQFAGHNFRVKFLYRVLCNSRAYQRTSKPTDANAEAGPELFARMAIKPLTPGQLFDSLVEVVGFEPGQQMFRGKANRPPALRGPNANPRNFFIAFFNLEDGSDPTEYQAGIPQVLRMMNGPMFNNAIYRLLPDLRGDGPAAVVERLYLRTLGRRPTPAERDRLAAYVNQQGDQRPQAFADVFWALLNSSEFVLNH